MEVREPSAKYLLGREPQLTELGPIPADWSVSSVGDEFHVQLGKMLDSEKNVGMPKPFLGNRAVQWGRIDVSDIGEIRLSPTDLHRYRLEEGDLLVCEGGEVGRSAIWRGQLDECYYQKALHRLRAKRGYSHEFMAFLLEQFARSGKLQDYVTQTSIAHLPKEKFIALPIPRPATDDEQHRIASVLADADALIDSLEQLLTKKRQIKQGAMQELLTGKRRLPGFTGEWKTASLGQIAKVKTGSMNNQDKVDDGEYPFFVRSQSVERIDVFTHDCEAILVPGEGGIGSIFHYIQGRFALHQRVYGITDFSDEVLGRFLFFFMRVFFGAHAMENTVKATVDSLRLPTFLNFELRLPPTKDEQTAIVEVLSDLESAVEALELRLTKARALKQAMAQALLTGRIRLVEPTA